MIFRQRECWEEEGWNPKNCQSDAKEATWEVYEEVNKPWDNA